jgi:hypothetical protein
VDAPDVEGYQKIAAEQVAGDESWRDGVEDEVAEPLLDWALECTDGAVARLAGAGALTEDATYEAADQARALLEALGSHWRGGSWESVAEAVEPSLGPPLFESPAAGAESVVAALTRARVEPGGAEAVGEALHVERRGAPAAPEGASAAPAPEPGRPAAPGAPSEGVQKAPDGTVEPKEGQPQRRRRRRG